MIFFPKISVLRFSRPYGKMILLPLSLNFFSTLFSSRQPWHFLLGLVFTTIFSFPTHLINTPPPRKGDKELYTPLFICFCRAAGLCPVQYAERGRWEVRGRGEQLWEGSTGVGRQIKKDFTKGTLSKVFCFQSRGAYIAQNLIFSFLSLIQNIIFSPSTVKILPFSPFFYLFPIIFAYQCGIYTVYKHIIRVGKNPGLKRKRKEKTAIFFWVLLGNIFF